MKRFIMYADYKNDQTEEYLNIYLDTELNEKSKTVLYNYINDYISRTFDLTENETGNEYKFTRNEFDHMLTKREYYFGDVNNVYLYPTSITVKIVDDESISLKGLMLQ